MAVLCCAVQTWMDGSGSCLGALDRSHDFPHRFDAAFAKTQHVSLCLCIKCFVLLSVCVCVG